MVDLRLGDGNGLDVVSALKRKRPDARTIVLTGYGNIATAVTAVKMGAVDYLAKPADADDIIAALACHRHGKVRAAAESDVGGPGAMGAHPAHLRDVQPQRLGDGAAAQHASPHLAADSRQTRTALSSGSDPDYSVCSPARPVALRSRLITPGMSLDAAGLRRISS